MEKSQVVKALQVIDVDRYALDKVDARLLDYITECISNPSRHNMYELLAIQRFFHLFDKYDFRAIDVKRFIAFYEFLKFQGKKGPTRYKLTPVQTFQIANIKGFYLHSYIDEYTGLEVVNKRLIREALLFVPRKFGKTTMIASFAVEDLLFGDANAQAYAGANSYDQAQICFGEIKKILSNLDPKMSRFKINREQVFNLTSGKSSFARCLSSSPDKLDGLNASLVILDEYSQADSAELKNVLTSSMGARHNPLTLYITTASGKRDTPFTDMLKRFKEVLRGERDDDSVFAHIFEPDEGDAEDDPNTWRKVQPHWGVTIQTDFYKNEYKKALGCAEDMQAFRNKLLNVFTSETKSTWISADEIEGLMKECSAEGSVAVTSVDLSVRDDFSAVTWLIHTPQRQNEAGDGFIPWHSITKYFIPRKTLETHQNSELYKRWYDGGYLTVLEGDVIDYKEIATELLKSPYEIRALGYDSYKSKEMINILRTQISKRFLVPVPQTYGAFTSPVEAMEILVGTKQITFDPNPITAYCFGNAVLDEDKMRNRKPLKAAKNAKIDGVITNLMGLWLTMNIA